MSLIALAEDKIVDLTQWSFRFLQYGLPNYIILILNNIEFYSRKLNCFKNKNDLKRRVGDM